MDHRSTLLIWDKNSLIISVLISFYIFTKLNHKRILFSRWHGLSHYHNTRDLVFSSHEIDAIEKNKATATLFVNAIIISREKKSNRSMCRAPKAKIIVLPF